MDDLPDRKLYLVIAHYGSKELRYHVVATNPDRAEFLVKKHHQDNDYLDVEWCDIETIAAEGTYGKPHPLLIA